MIRVFGEVASVNGYALTDIDGDPSDGAELDLWSTIEGGFAYDGKLTVLGGATADQIKYEVESNGVTVSGIAQSSLNDLNFMFDGVPPATVKINGSKYLLADNGEGFSLGEEVPDDADADTDADTDADADTSADGDDSTSNATDIT